MLEAINRQIEINRLEKDVKDSETLYTLTVRALRRAKEDAIGKTVKAVEKNIAGVLIVFTDGTYLCYEADHDYGGTELNECTPDQWLCDKHGIGDQEALKKLDQARQAMTAYKLKDEYKSHLDKLVRAIGKENAMKLLSEIP